MLVPRGPQADGLIFWAPLIPGVSGGVAYTTTASTEFVWPYGQAMKYKTNSPVPVSAPSGIAYEMRNGATNRGWTQDNWKSPATLGAVTITARCTLKGTLVSYDNIVDTKPANGVLMLLASGGSGRPLTCQMGANANSVTYFNALTGLTIPTTGEFLAVGQMDGTTMRCMLSTPGGSLAYYEWTGVTAYSHQNDFSASELGIGYDPVNGRYWQGTVKDVRIYSRALSFGEVDAIAKAPERLWTEPRRTYSIPASTATDLVVADASFPVSFESPTLAQVHELAAQDATLPVAFDQVTLTQVHQLTAADATFPTSFDAPALTQLHELAVEDASLPTSFENVTLTQGQTLVVQDATLPVTFDSPSLGQVHSLIVADSSLPATFDSPALTQAHQLAADDAAIAILFESPTLFQAHSLAADDATLPVTFDNVVVKHVVARSIPSVVARTAIVAPTSTAVIIECKAVVDIRSPVAIASLVEAL